MEAMAAARALGTALELPVVVSIDQVLSAARARALRDPVVRWVLVPTEAHRAHYLGRAKLARDNVTVLPLAIDVEHLAAVGADTVGDALTIGMVAQRGDRSLLSLVAAVQALRAGGRAVKLAIAAGPGSTREEHLNVLAEHGTDGWCEVLASRGHDALISRCDVLVQPSGDDRGVAPVIAALGAGRVVVSAANTGADELLDHGRTALVLPDCSTAALSEEIGRVLDDAALRRRLGETAQADARARFAIAVVGPALVELYRLAVGAQQDPGAKREGSRAYKRRVTTRSEPAVPPPT
jgi:glycosyltransferase involved in cell wall biosynthesis